jgi:hypothetical protein
VSDVIDDRFPESSLYAGHRLETARQETGMRKRILETLEAGPKTIPEIAASLGLPSSKVLWWVMGCVRYSFVEPSGETTPEGYHKYRIAGRDE